MNDKHPMSCHPANDIKRMTIVRYYSTIFRNFDAFKGELSKVFAGKLNWAFARRLTGVFAGKLNRME